MVTYDHRCKSCNLSYLSETNDINTCMMCGGPVEIKDADMVFEMAMGCGEHVPRGTKTEEEN